MKWTRIYSAQIGANANFANGPRDVVIRCLADKETPPLVTQDVELCLAEVFNNFIEHELEERPYIEISIFVKITPTARRFLVLDTGRKVPSGAYRMACMPEVDHQVPADLPEGGFGLALVKTLAERFLYRREGDLNVTFLEFCTPQNEQT